MIRAVVAFALLGIASLASEELAAVLGAGFILANLVRVMNSKDPFVGGVPTINTKEFPYDVLSLGGSAKSADLQAFSRS